MRLYKKEKTQVDAIEVQQQFIEPIIVLDLFALM
jgi:hypothetical protein